MFYMNHTLCSSDNKNSWFKQCPFPISKEEIMERLKGTKYFNLPENTTAEDILIDVQQYNGETTAEVSLIVPMKYPNIDRVCRHKIAAVSIAVTNYNCGAVHVSNLYANDGRGCGLAWDLLKHVEDWCIYAGYTLLYGNVAGSYQMGLLPKFKSIGFVEMGQSYKNKRTGNVNIWLQKVIQDQSLIGVSDEDDDWGHDDYYEESEEEENF